MTLGQRLENARKSVGFTLENVGEKTGIGASSLSEMENGKREPKISQLAALARCYQRSLAFFLDESPAQEPRVLWRKQPEGEEVAEHERRFRRYCEQYKRLETWCDDFVKPRLPKVEPGRKPFGYADAADLAERMRRELNLGERPALVLLKALELDCGIRIFHDDFEPTGAAACLADDGLGRAILLNSGNTPERRSFDLAHELFHLLVADAKAETPALEFEKDEEKLAGCFASHLLIPSEILQRSIDRRLDNGSLSLEEIAEVAQEFAVSPEALLWGIHRAYNLGESRREEIRGRVAKFHEEWASNPPPKCDPAPQKYPERYRMLAIRALNAGEMSVGKFMEYLEVNRREAMSHLREEGVRLGEVQVASR